MKNFMATLERYFTRLGRERVRQRLLRLDDRLLADAGFSRELLSAGIKAWPWRTARQANLASTPTASALSEAEIRLAIAQLRSFNDMELNDLGLARGDIEYAVRYGRQQDRQIQRKAA